MRFAYLLAYILESGCDWKHIFYTNSFCLRACPCDGSDRDNSAIGTYRFSMLISSRLFRLNISLCKVGTKTADMPGHASMYIYMYVDYLFIHYSQLFSVGIQRLEFK